jgi:hypothetical protein
MDAAIGTIHVGARKIIAAPIQSELEMLQSFNYSGLLKQFSRTFPLET